MSIFKKRTQNLTQESYRINGMYYHIDKQGIRKFLNENKIYRSNKKILDAGMAMRKVYRYDAATLPAKLVAEPKNPHDENAVAIYVSRKHIGYIPADHAKHVRELMKKRLIVNSEVEIYGGEYKVVSLDGSGVADDCDFSVRITIYYNG